MMQDRKILDLDQRIRAIERNLDVQPARHPRPGGGGAQIDIGVITAVVSDSSPYVTVRPVRQTAGTPWNGKFRFLQGAGDGFTAHLYPLFLGRHVRNMIYAAADGILTDAAQPVLVIDLVGLRLAVPIPRIPSILRPPAPVIDSEIVA